MMWAGCYNKTAKMRRAVVFAEHSTKGSRDPWFIDEGSGAVYLRRWDEVLQTLYDGTPKKMAIYPMAEAQILTNSQQFYTPQT